MKRQYDIEFERRSEIHLSGDIHLRLEKGSAHRVQVEAEVAPDELGIDVSFARIDIIDLLRKARQKETIEDAIKGLDLQHGILRFFTSGIASVQKAIEADSKMRRMISVTVVIPPSMEELLVEADNLLVEKSSISMDTIKLKAANLKLDPGSDFLVRDVKIKSSNLKGALHLHPQCSQVRIKANNGKFVIQRHSGYRGLITCDGNNLKVVGHLDGLPADGKCEILMNNGKVEILEEKNEKAIV